jgi:hypothetical protein
MATPPSRKNANVKLLACIVDEDNVHDDDYRVLVDGQHVKYLITAPGAFRALNPTTNDRVSEPILLGELLPPFPTGDWNQGHVARDPEKGMPTFVAIEILDFAGVKNLWHPMRVNELELSRQHQLNYRVYVTTHPDVNHGRPVVVKFTAWPWEIPWMEVETAAYQWLDGTGICPKFMGHLTEGPGGRVIGFVAEWIEGARPAGPEDYDGCKKTLGRLHARGIRFGGDLNAHNFLVRDGHDVVLVDFEGAKPGCLPAALEDEMAGLERVLNGIFESEDGSDVEDGNGMAS